MRWSRFTDLMVSQVKANLSGNRPRLPEGGVLLWQWFGELCESRTYHPGGPNALQPTEIEAWARLRRHPLQPRHVDALLAMDRAWLDHSYGAIKQARGIASGAPTGREAAVSPAAFDAVFG
ncbi:hypothetical protein [Mesorhizobium sp. J428]|uniref:phage tail assembly chaperone n=1 Tax=Mesorhizobium sp. J428 TaxID=2898440 RepID=UPI0021509C2C|nr:hypothetical protein [Mesorhizobium sp. J428]MCR5856580.1 hypothetical protein [Mesorhizobium sp. J428]